MSQVDEILSFWFGELRDDKAYGDGRFPIWFAQNPQFDQEIKVRFAADYQLAAERKLDDWKKTPRGSLALILLLDQFPRNMFRGDRQAFATDPLALEVAEYMIREGFDLELLPIARLFVYLPFMHSEKLEHQRQSVALFQKLAQERDYVDALPRAIRRMEIIERFGRYPPRNTILGRVSTPEEVEFLKQSGSSS